MASEEEKLYAPTTPEGEVKGVDEWDQSEVWGFLQTLPYASRLTRPNWEFVSGKLLADISEDNLKTIGVFGPLIPRLLLDIEANVVAIERKKIVLGFAADETKQEERRMKRQLSIRKTKEQDVDMICGCIPRIRKKIAEPRVFRLEEGEEDERHEVRLQVFVNSIGSIDSSTETWSADFWVRAIWKDDYLFEVRKAGQEFRLDWDDPGWFQPKLEVVNSHELDLVLEQKFVSGDEIYCEQRWRGSLHSDMDLRLFPYDRQYLRVDVESSFHATKFIKLVTAIDKAPLFSHKCQNHPEFKVLRGDLLNTISKLEFVTEDDADFERYSLTLLVERRSGFYVARVGFLNVICVLIGISIDFLDPGDPGKRLDITTTMFLTLVAFQFAVADSMPKISYFTLLDWMILICYFVMMATILQAIVQYNRSIAGVSEADLFTADVDGFITLCAVLLGSVVLLSVYGLRSFIRGVFEQTRATGAPAPGEGALPLT
jgi:hypothetical protein